MSRRFQSNHVSNHVASACAVCKKGYPLVNIYACDRCRFVHYCSREHEDLYTNTTHDSVRCAAFAALPPFQCDVPAQSCGNAWLSHRKSQMQQFDEQVSKATGVSLTDESILAPIIFQRACVICKSTKDVYECATCGVATFCSKTHEDEAATAHHAVCGELQLMMACERRAATASPAEVESESSRYLQFIKPQRRSPTPLSTWQEYFFSQEAAQLQALKRDAAWCELTQILSFPLTIVHALRCLGDAVLPFQDHLCIHVIGAAYTPELRHLGVYEEVRAAASANYI
ncbi:hypothetical protein CYMTET_37307 [Cymbomonas tetramitiformis]|uniref:MYND-type domain-containing protein n=1 Tax=Cymbomonas tetramitiformis TaxID=36881 RepID=A0AAE0CFZ9_9CHLO|nr:hypothetical protein CYMTET_37307 [Cymbomonas tetramitiformis]